MEKVVATVSGYQGSQRFNLIKLIAKAGGNYVGTMSDSVTHLVCWRFEGRKYELARKSRKTSIVNHRWIEDCLKKGKRIQEHPYTLQCGEEVGPVLMNTTPVSESNISSEKNSNDSWTDNAFEEYVPNLGIHRHRPGKKNNSKSFKCDHKLSSSHHIDDPSISGSQRIETEEFLRAKKRGRDLPETSRKRRRLVKKNCTDVLEISDSEQLSPPMQPLPGDESIMQSYNVNAERHEDIFNDCETSQTTNMINGKPGKIGNMINGKPGKIGNMINGESSFSSFKSPPKQMQVVGVDTTEESSIRLPTSPELSCVICWTDFSSTRGLLPCGHRFCFPCIQSWADQMVSRGKTSTCPLCKVGFASITKVDAAVCSDQKIYSQTIPHDRPGTDIYILPDGETSQFPANATIMPPACCQCLEREPEELLIYCHVCQVRCIHEYCLDPPLQPWTCIHCKDIQRRYLTYYRPNW